MIGRLLLLVSAGLSFAGGALAQTWARTYGRAAGNEGAYSIRKAPGGGFVFCGTTGSFRGTTDDGLDDWVVKISVSGTIVWQKRLPTSGYWGSDDVARRVETTPDGGCFVLADLLNADNDEVGWGVLLQRFDSLGLPAWNVGDQSSGREPGDWKTGGLGRTADGGVVIANNSASGLADVAKLNAQGGASWDLEFRGGVVRSLTVAENGAVYLAGNRNGDAWLARILPDGSRVLWQKTLGGAGFDEFLSVQALPDGGAVAAGSTRSYGAGRSDAWIVRWSPEGAVVWQEAIGRARDDVAHEIRTTGDGGFVIAGSTRRDVADLDAWLVKLGPNGAVVWERAYGGKSDESAYSVETLADGYAIAGRTRSYGKGGGDALVIRTDLAGQAPCPSNVPGSRRSSTTARPAAYSGSVYPYHYPPARVLYNEFWTATTASSSPVSEREALRPHPDLR